ncbi:MAG: GFA family protein [Xanthomonadales bacterium]|nr:GFA family protein [Xanthomonadales bacterium]
MKPALKFYSGGCHCGAVQYKVRLPANLEVHRCNCSICQKCGFLHLIVNAADFELIKGAGNLNEYNFNSGVARHLFCKHCGVKSFYVPRSHPDGYSVNFRCVDLPGSLACKIIDFDGRNWTENIAKITE